MHTESGVNDHGADAYYDVSMSIILALLAGLASSLVLGTLTLHKDQIKTEPPERRNVLFNYIELEHAMMVSLLTVNVLASEYFAIYLARLMEDHIAGIVSSLVLLVFCELFPQALGKLYNTGVVYRLRYFGYISMVATACISIPMAMVIESFKADDDSDDPEGVGQAHGKTPLGIRQQLWQLSQSSMLGPRQKALAESVADFEHRCASEFVVPPQFVLRESDTIDSNLVARIPETDSNIWIPVVADGSKILVAALRYTTVLRCAACADPGGEVTAREAASKQTMPPVVAGQVSIAECARELINRDTDIVFVKGPGEALCGVITMDSLIQDVGSRTPDAASKVRIEKGFGSGDDPVSETVALL